MALSASRRTASTPFPEAEEGAPVVSTWEAPAGGFSNLLLPQDLSTVGSDLAKVGVEGSNPFCRSTSSPAGRLCGRIRGRRHPGDEGPRWFLDELRGIGGEPPEGEPRLRWFGHHLSVRPGGGARDRAEAAPGTAPVGASPQESGSRPEPA